MKPSRQQLILLFTFIIIVIGVSGYEVLVMPSSHSKLRVLLNNFGLMVILDIASKAFSRYCLLILFGLTLVYSYILHFLFLANNPISDIRTINDVVISFLVFDLLVIFGFLFSIYLIFNKNKLSR